MRQLDAQEVKEAIALSDVIGLFVDWDARKSIPAKGEYWACCPFHGEKTASFKVSDDGWFYCHGCGAKGDHYKFLQDHRGMSFSEALREVAELAGYDVADQGLVRSVERSRAEVEAARKVGAEAHSKGAQRKDNPHDKNDMLHFGWREGWEASQQKAVAEHSYMTAREGLQKASAIWQAASAEHDVLREYLAARGVDMSALGEVFPKGLPDTLRCHPDLGYWSCDRAGNWSCIHSGPAMVALVTSPDFRLGTKHERVAGIHRTWITPTGRAAVDGQKLDKRMLGATRLMMPVPIELSSGMVDPIGDGVSARMIVGEGIETSLTVWSFKIADYLAGSGELWHVEAAKTLGALTGSPDDNQAATEGKPVRPDWNAPGWRAPQWVNELVILAEGSPKNPDRARAIYEMARQRHSYKRDGAPRLCRLARPSDDWGSADDFADLARREMSA